MLRNAPRKDLLRPFLLHLSHLRNRHLLVLDVLFLSLTPALALLLRVERMTAFRPELSALLVYTLLALVLRVAVFSPMGLYNRYWRYAAVDELTQTALAVFISTFLIITAYLGYVLIGQPTHYLPRSLPFIDGLLALVIVGGIRFGVCLAHRLQQEAPLADARNALIAGAGSAGQRIAKELQTNPKLGLRPVGFVDDDAYKQGLRILNLPVLGGCDDLVELAHRHNIAQVIIAMPSAPGKTVRKFLTLCEVAQVPAKTVPSISAMLGDKVHVSLLRNVEIEDLLRREPIQTNIAAVRKLIHGKRVLITGGGGSIGSELCRQVLQCRPRDMALVGHGENSVFEIQNELLSARYQCMETSENGTEDFGPTAIHAFIADIRFPQRIHNVVQRFRPDLIFHAAAHKHVPLMELNPSEAISNNVIGTRNVLEAALAADVERFVMISTDKAVNPSSIMGASKRAAEMLVLQAAERSRKPYVAVRFGNVLGSRGSVVPTFRRQIAAGGPVTVSHPDMRRYFMTIPEAVQLLLQASVLGQGGEIFMLDMGEPVKIVDLAKDLIELSGLEVGRDIDIVYTGIRPGEKLYEELSISGEAYQPTAHAKILIARNASSFVPTSLDEAVSVLEGAAAEEDCAAILRTLRHLIPEYRSQEALQDREHEHAVVQNQALHRQHIPRFADSGPVPTETPYPAQATHN
jgi:FlaA1/EpsC-like NDP-sugar epimerase